jgi:hypothetical protein
MDDFGAKNIGKEHVMHLIKTLKEHCKVKEDWGYLLGITMDWDYKNREVHLSMPDYVESALALAQFTPHSKDAQTPATPTYNPYIWSHSTVRTHQNASHQPRKIHPRSDKSFPLLQTCCRSHYVHSTWHNRIRPSQTYKGYHDAL